MSSILRLAPVFLISLTLGCSAEQPAGSSNAASTPTATPGTDATSAQKPDDTEAMPRIEMKTSLGTMTIELNRTKAPISVENFLRYVESEHYDGTIFHRVIKGFMDQGGGMTPDGVKKPTRAPIALEAGNGLMNTRGTIAMARTSDPNSATAQFFINTVDNSGKWPGSSTSGYAVFGKVVEGMSVADDIANTPVGAGNRPVTAVIIESVRRL